MKVMERVQVWSGKQPWWTTVIGVDGYGLMDGDVSRKEDDVMRSGTHILIFDPRVVSHSFTFVLSFFPFRTTQGF